MTNDVALSTADIFTKSLGLDIDAMIAAWPDQEQARWDRQIATYPFLADAGYPPRPDPDRRHPAMRVMRDFMLFVMAHHNRRVLDRVAIVPLVSDAEAVRAGWPDGRTANAAALCTAALLRQSRDGMTLPHPILVDARTRKPAGIGEWRADPEDIASPSHVVAAFRDLNARPVAAMLGREADEETAKRGFESALAAPLVQSILGIDPEILVRRLHALWDAPHDANVNLDNRHVLSGLGTLLEVAVFRSKEVKARHLAQIRLMGERDAADFGVTDAATSNLIAALAAAIASERHMEITFVAPRTEADPRREAVLRALASYVYWSGLDDAAMALDTLCNENVILSPSPYKRGNDLLQRIRREEDPNDVRFNQLSIELRARADWGWQGHQPGGN